MHVPFCRARCAYCDFVSEVLPAASRATVAADYLAAVGTELAWYAPLLGQGLETAYVGGGTPTHVPVELLASLVSRVAASELTVEANPESLDARVVTCLLEAGMSRLSIGIQSFDVSLRRTLGRNAREEAVVRACTLPRLCGLDNWNLDLIFGIPGQTWPQVRKDLETAVAAAPTHISLYDLTYTPSYEARVARRPGPEARARAEAFAERHYHRAVAFLEAQGYLRYEVSNFALPGYECRHNLAYWQGEDYLGVGASAVSTVGSLRWTNAAGAADYATWWKSTQVHAAGRGVEARPVEGSPRPSPAVAELELIPDQVRLYERAMLGLRTRRGVPRSGLESVLDVPRLEALIASGLVEERCGTLTLSAGGLNVSNAVLSAILIPPAAERPPIQRETRPS